MATISVSDELANKITMLAVGRGCTPAELLQCLVKQTQSDDALAENDLTPALQARMLEDRDRVAHGEFITEDEVDRKFEMLYKSLASRELASR